MAKQLIQAKELSGVTKTPQTGNVIVSGNGNNDKKKGCCNII